MTTLIRELGGPRPHEKRLEGWIAVLTNAKIPESSREKARSNLLEEARTRDSPKIYSDVEMLIDELVESWKNKSKDLPSVLKSLRKCILDKIQGRQ